jgi:hypothetical protein
MFLNLPSCSTETMTLLQDIGMARREAKTKIVKWNYIKV